MKILRLAASVWIGSLLFFLLHVAFFSNWLDCQHPFCLNAAQGASPVAVSGPIDQFRTDQEHQKVALVSSRMPQPKVVGPLAQAESDSTATSPASAANISAVFEEMPIAVLGLLASLLAGLATGVGALPILFTKRISDQLQGSLLGFAAGVMLAATSFSLLIPSIERITAAGGNQFYAAGVAVGGTLIGSGFIWLTDRALPYHRFIDIPDGIDAAKLKGIWLFIFAIAIHNFPEGLAVGVGFGGGNIGNGLALAIGIGLQNIPEGLAVALALFTQKYSKWKAFWIALLTGLLEPLGGFFGVGIITLGEALLPWGLAFAAGAMLFVIGDEVIPEAQHLEPGKLATAGIVVGFIIMMFLDISLG